MFKWGEKKAQTSQNQNEQREKKKCVEFDKFMWLKIVNS